jgi:hypothetical protein
LASRPGTGGGGARRRLALAGVGALVLVAALIVWRSRASAPALTAAEAAAPGVPPSWGPAPALHAGGPALAADPKRGDDDDEPGLRDGPSEAEIRAFRRWRVDNLRRAARFPGDSLPLTARHREALTEVQPDRGAVTDPGPGGLDVLVAYPARPFFQAGEPILLHAAVVHARDGTRSAARITGTLMKAIDGPHDGALATVTYRDDGAGGDAVAGDLLYTAQVTPAILAPELLVGQVEVEVSATLADGRERFVVSQFRAGTPGARLTGRFRDRLEGGHLILEADLAVVRPGRYHLQGGLEGPGGTPVAWAQHAEVIDAPGAATLSLRFFGLAFHEAGISGPYRLAFVSVAETGRRPVLQGPVLEGAHVTAPYAVADFSGAPHQDPAWDETIRQAEAIEGMPLAPGVVRGR